MGAFYDSICLPGTPPESARRAHPTPEHFLPFFVAAGAGAADHGTLLHRSFSHGSISMSAFSFGDGELAA